MTEAPRRPTPADQATRTRVVATLDRPLVVEAGAGTGKTTLLVERLLQALAQGVTEMAGVVAISFTEKAAAELRLRLRQSLEERVAAVELDEAVRQRLRRALQELHRGQISTIHAYASALLRERPAEARLDPQFRVLDEIESLQLQRSFWRRWVDEELEDPHGAPLLREALLSGVRLEPDLQRLVRALYDNRDLDLVLRTPPLPVDVEPRMLAWRDGLRACVEHARLHCLDPADKGARHLEDWARRLEALADLARAAWPSVILQDLRLDSKAGRRDRWAPGACEASKVMRRQLQEQLQALRQDLMNGVLARALQWSRRFLSAYGAEKARLGVVDFQDLLLYARRLLRDHLDVRRDLGRRVQMLCVDEFQDTDPLQAEMVLYLAEAEHGATRWQDVRVGPKLFLVGDPKQSIYRFRRADLDVYRQCCDIVRRSGGEVVDIVQNFRSRPAILHWVNGVFETLFGAGSEHPPQPRHVPLVPLPGDETQPALWILRPGVDEAEPENAEAARRGEARTIVAGIQRALAEGWSVRDGQGRRALLPGDVAILFARTSGIEHYEDALRAAGLPFRQEGGKLFFQRQEVRDVLHALAAIDDPQDEYAIVAALRSPLFGASDEDLWLHRQRFGGFGYLEPTRGSPLDGALRKLHALHGERHRHGVGGITARLLERTSARAVYAAQAQGERAILNFDTLLRRARAFEASRPAGLRDFVLALRDLDEESPRLAEWSPEEESPEQVRLLTVHMAKGLEFPCVALANLSARGSMQLDAVVYDRAEETAEVRLTASDWRTQLEPAGYARLAEREREREQAEERRLLYVAATRARDYLFLGDFAARRPEGLLRSLREVTGALGDGTWTALPEPVRVEGETPRDAAWCVLHADALVYRRRLPQARPPRVDVDARLAARLAWRQERTAGRRDVERPVRLLQPDAWWHEIEAGTEAQNLERLVHDVLDLLGREPTAGVLEGCLQESAQRLGLMPHVRGARPLVERALQGDWMRRARRSERVWTGLHLMHATEAAWLEAVLDLVFDTGSGCVLVDFTTRQQEPSGVEENRRGLAVRSWLLQQTGRTVVEAGTVFLEEGVYEALSDLPRRLQGLDRTLSRPRSGGAEPAGKKGSRDGRKSTGRDRKGTGRESA